MKGSGKRGFRWLKGWFLLAWCLSGGLLPARVFTSPDGKTFVGEIVSAGPQSVVIERVVDRRRFTVPLAKLSQADQDYVAQWKADNPELKLSFDVARDDRSLKNEKLHKVNEECFKIIVKNGAAQATPPLQLYYTQYERTTNQRLKGKDKKQLSETQSGRIEIPAIPAFGEVTVRTDPMKIELITEVEERQERDLEGRLVKLYDYFTIEEELKGMNFLVFFKEREVAKWDSSGFQDQRVDLKAAGFGAAPDAAKDKHKQDGEAKGKGKAGENGK